MLLRSRYPSTTTIVTDRQCTKKSKVTVTILSNVPPMTTWSVNDPVGMATANVFRPLPEFMAVSLDRDTVPTP